MQGDEVGLPLQTLWSQQVLLHIKALILEGIAVVQLTQMDLVKAQEAIAELLGLASLHPALLGRPLRAMLHLLTGLHLQLATDRSPSCMAQAWHVPCLVWKGHHKLSSQPFTEIYLQPHFGKATKSLEGQCRQAVSGVSPAGQPLGATLHLPAGRHLWTAGCTVTGLAVLASNHLFYDDNHGSRSPVFRQCSTHCVAMSEATWGDAV